MSANITNQVAFLRTSRNFPLDPQQLVVEVNKSYIDIANAVNNRIIGLFTTTAPSVTGESYFIANNTRQQTLRQVFAFSGTTSITHNIRVTSLTQFTNCFGTYTDGTSCMGLIWGTSSATTIPGQISFYMTTTQIVFVVDAASPALTSGRLVLEWLSNP